jgi:hypothetical protein
MRTSPHAPWFPGRIYSKDDLHTTALVCMDRREVVLKELLNQFRHLSDDDIKSVVRNAEFLYTCNEGMFDEYRQRHWGKA